MSSDKPHINIIVLGHVDHGKSTLISAITWVMGRNYALGEIVSVKDIDSSEPVNVYGVDIKTTEIEVETPDRIYTFIDCYNHSDYMKRMIMHKGRIDGAILVVSACDGPMSQTREHIHMAQEIGIPQVIPFFNKSEFVDDEEIVELIEMELDELLAQYGYMDYYHETIRGSALKAIEDPDSEWGDKIDQLME